MKRSQMIFALAISLFLAPTLWSGSASYAKKKIKVTFKDTCHCIKCHAKYRWDAKTDDEELPFGAIPTGVTPSAVGSWEGPGGVFHMHTGRSGREEHWFALTGRVSLVRIEPDGDLYIQLVDEGAKDDDVNTVVEVPFGDRWCDIRQQVLGWTKQGFPLTITQSRKLSLKSKPVIEVVGKAFYDAAHDGGHSDRNRRPVPRHPALISKHVTIWEIHPVMNLQVIKN